MPEETVRETMRAPRKPGAITVRWLNAKFVFAGPGLTDAERRLGTKVSVAERAARVTLKNAIFAHLARCLLFARTRLADVYAERIAEKVPYTALKERVEVVKRRYQRRVITVPYRYERKRDKRGPYVMDTKTKKRLPKEPGLKIWVKERARGRERFEYWDTETRTKLAAKLGERLWKDERRAPSRRVSVPPTTVRIVSLDVHYRNPPGPWKWWTRVREGTSTIVPGAIVGWEAGKMPPPGSGGR